MCSMVGGAFGVAVLGGIYRGLELAQLHGDAAAAQPTSEQQQQVNDAFASTEKAQEIYKTLPEDVKRKVEDAVMAALATASAARS